MGEPQPGDIPDPTHIKTENILLDADVIASKGDWINYNTGTDFWGAIPNQTFERIITERETVQLQQDIQTTGLVDGAANAAAFGNGSWVYALLGGDVLPNTPVILVVYDSGSGVFKIGFVNSLTINGDASLTSNVGTFVSDEDNGYKVGDKVTIIAASLNGGAATTVIITRINSSTSFDFDFTETNFTTESATSDFSAINNGGAAKFIKRSGDTFAQKGTINEVAVVAMTGLGL
jgi:hypothetical protein